MSRRSRLRTFAARASLTMLVALMVVWGASAWVGIHWHFAPRYMVSIADGACWFERDDGGFVAAEHVVWVLPLESRRWCFEFYRESGSGFWLRSIPLWAFAAPLAMATALLWRSELAARRRKHPELCPRCGYNNAATPTGAPCPECGTPTSSTTAAPIDAAPPTA
ncbi:MAG: hypothetical protein K2Y21_05500 [Phycisphaerales bacterium]|nr:hypothetical protein [Phycisphaerales bacterium]